MALEPVVTQIMGPERICPNEHEELGLQETPDGTPEPAGEWSSEEPEEEEEDGSNGYLYQPLNQDPDQGLAAAEETEPSTEPTPDINERLQVAQFCFKYASWGSSRWGHRFLHAHAFVLCLMLVMALCTACRQ